MEKITRNQILQRLRSPSYQPMTSVQLQDALGVRNKGAGEFRKLIKELEDDGVIVMLRHKGYVLTANADLVSGTISFTRGGSAFVQQDPAIGQEVFIHRRDTGTALPGDKVLARIKSDQKRVGVGGKRTAKVIRVLKRKDSTIVGTLRKQRNVYYVEPMRLGMTTDLIVPGKGRARIGDRVVVELGKWDDDRINPVGRIIEVIGPADTPALDTISVIKAYSLPGDFPVAAIHESDGMEIDSENLGGRRDLRKNFTFTIDPATARDYDDAISFEKIGKGKSILGVHIADVSHFVRPGSALDKEARKRGNSVYLPDLVIPMLPERLSNGLCSLQEKVDRLALSVFMTIGRDGVVTNAEFCESIIRNDVRLTYEQALTALIPDAEKKQGTEKLGARLVSKLREVHEVTRKLRKNRFRDGALDLAIPEVKIEVGPNGKISNVRTESTDPAHQLIEECMLLANEEVCKSLSNWKIPHIHRIHEEPDPERIAALEQMFLLAGIEPGDLTKQDNLCQLVREIRDAPQAHAWNVAVLRSMKKAEYSVNPTGHYGLAKSYYTHFTSPIRRYADLVIHRILKSTLSKSKPVYTAQRLSEISEHCSETETLATKAERDIIELKILRYFSEQLESGNPIPHKAVVIDVRNFGLMIDLPEIQASGMVPVSTMSDDFFDFNPIRKELHGRRSRLTYGIGSTLQVIIAKVTPDKRFLDFVPC